MTADPESVRRPRLMVVGPLVGRTGRHVTTQGEILADLFTAEGYVVLEKSSVENRYLRLGDILRGLLLQVANYDLILLQAYGGPSFVVEDAVTSLAKALGKPVILMMRGGGFPDFIARHPVWSKRVFRRATAIVVQSGFLGQAIESMGLRCHVIPNVLDLRNQDFRVRTKAAPHLLWMRSFHHVWNPFMAIRAFARVARDIPEARLVMAGEDKGLLSPSVQLGNKLGISHAIRFPGFLDVPAKAREFGLADIFISSNIIDNTPVAVLEACASGLPVVSTRVGGVPYLLTEGETGLMVESDDAGGMAAAILRILTEPGLCERLSRNGRRLAENCSWDRQLPAWQSLFNDVLRAKRVKVE